MGDLEAIGHFDPGPWGARRVPAAERPNDSRDCWERDRSRVVHSSAFRRLQGKTQVLGIGEGDFHRTRLTHSMEVAQIGRGIVLHLRRAHEDQEPVQRILPTLTLIEVAGFAHDLGHPPYGHGGERALHSVMRPHGGFESNAQSLRILTRLQSHTPDHGLNLTRRALLAILKYPVPYSRLDDSTQPLSGDGAASATLMGSPPKCHFDSEREVVDWILRPFSASDRRLLDEIDTARTPPRAAHRSLDCRIMELADDISYGVHDFEDAVVLGLLDRDHWTIRPDLLAAAGVCPQEKSEVFLDDIFERRRGLRTGRRRRAIGALVHALVTASAIKEDPLFEDPLLRWRVTLPPEADELLQTLQALLVRHVIDHPNVQTLETRGRHMVLRLFEALRVDPRRLLRPSFVIQGENTGDWDRAICDFIAGMTDGYAARLYERLFIPRHGSIFERL